MDRLLTAAGRAFHGYIDLTKTPVTHGSAAQSVSLCSSTLSHLPAFSSIPMVSCVNLQPPTKYGHPSAV